MIKIDSKKIKKAVASVIPFVDKTSLSGYNNIVLSSEDNKLKLIATDSNAHTGIIKKFETLSQNEKINVLVDAEKFKKIILATKEETKITQKDNKIRISSHRTSFNLPISSTENYIGLPGFGGKYETIKNYKLLFLIKKVIDNASKNASSKQMNAVFIKYDNGKLIMVATDSYQLGFAEIDADNGFNNIFNHGVLIFKEDMEKIKTVLDLISFDGKIKISFNENKLVLKFEDTTIWIRTAGSNYVSYESIFRERSSNIIHCSKRVLNDVLRDASIVISKEIPVLKFELTKNNIKISNNNGIYDFSSGIDVAYAGKDLILGISMVFLKEIISRKIDTENVEIDVENETEVIIIRGEKELDDRNYFYLLMPMDV